MARPDDSGETGKSRAMAPMRFPDRLRLPFAFDRDLLAADLRRLQATPWIRHFVTQNYQGDWSVIPLRGPAGARHPVLFRPDRHRVRGHADAGGLSLFCSVLDSFVCPLQAVGLMRLTPGSVIKEHSDHDLCFEQGIVRLHIPITTNDGIAFELNRRRVILEAGSCWYLRLSDPHSLANRGDADRVHLVIDASVSEWVEAAFTAAAGASP
jgi:Aspartyl/Asparaginyl beta-hydroxylase